MEDFSIHWNSRLSNASATLEVGQVVVRSGDGTYLPATAANRAATGRKSAGLARSNADTRNRSFAGQFCGIVPAGLSGLGEGPQDDYVRVDDEGFLERVTTPDFDADDVVGRCDADGTAYVVFGNAVVKDTIVAADIARSAGSAIDRVEGFNGTALETTDTPSEDQSWAFDGAKFRADQPGPRSKFDVKSPRFGAVGNGVADDTAAINLAIAAANVAGGTVYFPAGSYKVTAPLTELVGGVSLEGACDYTITTGARIYSYLTGPEPLIHLGDYGSINVATRTGVKNLTLIQVSDTAATFGTGGSFNRTTFQKEAHAAIEATGAGLWRVEGCSIIGFPIGIVMDGAEHAHVYNCSFNIDGGGTGYSEGTTRGVGIWLTIGATRDRGNTYPDATNANTIRHCLFSGGEMGIWAEGGIQNSIVDCGFNYGTDGIVIGAVTNLSISDVYYEASTYTNGVHRKDWAISPTVATNVSFDNCEMIGVYTPFKIDDVIYSLAIRNCTLGSLSGSYSIVGAANVVDYTIDNVYQTNPTLGLADGLGTGTGTTRVSGASTYGLSVNRLAPANAALDIRGGSTKPLIRIRETNYDLFLHRSASPRKHEVDYVTTSPLSGNPGGVKRATEYVAFDAAGSDVDVAAFEVLDLALVTVKVTVVQWHSTDPTKYMYAAKKQKAYRYGGAITLLGTFADFETYEDTDGSFAAPVLAVDGNNLVVTVGSHPTHASRAQVVVDVIQVRY